MNELNIYMWTADVSAVLHNLVVLWCFGKTGCAHCCCRLMLMALYNVSINVKGLKYISGNPGLLPLIRTLLHGEDTGTIQQHISLHSTMQLFHSNSS